MFPIRMATFLILMISHAYAEAALRAPTEPAVQKMTEAWRRRSEHVMTAVIELSVNRGTLGCFSRFHNEWGPSGDAAMDAPMRFALGGKKVRVDSLGWSAGQHSAKLWLFDLDSDFSDLVNQLTAERFDLALYSAFREKELEYRHCQNFTSLYDKERRSTFLASNGKQYPEALIFASPEPGLDEASYDLDNLIYQPLLLALRPFEVYAGIAAKRCTVDGHAVVRGRSCLRMREQVKGPTGPPCRWLFVDPERDYTILRYVADADNKPDVQIDIDYEKTADGGDWLPMTWHVMRTETRERPVQRFASIKVQHYGLNADVGAINFDASPPTGAWVADWYSKSEWIVRKDGSRRLILPVESKVAAPYETIVRSEPGDAYSTQCTATAKTWLLTATRLLAPALGALLCVVAVLSRNRR